MWYQNSFPVNSNLQVQLYKNTCLASGIDPERAEKSSKAVVFPTKSNLSASELITTYLAGTPFVDFLQTPLPFSIPFKTRFEHTHIVGGSGHGKTQLLQHLILRDLRQLEEGRGQGQRMKGSRPIFRTARHV